MARLTDEDYWEAHPGRATVLGIGAVWFYVLLIMALVGITTLVLWGAGVLFSPYKGRAQAYQRQQSATNRIFAQQHFEQLYGDIQAASEKLPRAAAEVKAHPGDAYFSTNYDGLYNTCIDLVNTYDQDSAKYLEKDFKTADLPPHIDPAATCPTS